MYSVYWHTGIMCQNVLAHICAYIAQCVTLLTQCVVTLQVDKIGGGLVEQVPVLPDRPLHHFDITTPLLCEPTYTHSPEHI